jgi:hypothetical protein
MREFRSMSQSLPHREAFKGAKCFTLTSTMDRSIIPTARHEGNRLSTIAPSAKLRELAP